MGCIILITEVDEETSCEDNCNLEPDECTVAAARKYEGSTRHLVHWTRRRLGLTHVGNTPSQLLRSRGQVLESARACLFMFVASFCAYGAH